MCDSGKGETFCERSKKEQSARKISRCARNDGMGGMGLFHVAYNGYVWKTPFPQRHPERSRGIFFVGGKRASVWQRETGNAVSQERWDGASRKRHSEGVMEKRDEKDFLLLEMREDIPEKSANI